MPMPAMIGTARGVIRPHIQSAREANGDRTETSTTAPPARVPIRPAAIEIWCSADRRIDSTD